MAASLATMVACTVAACAGSKDTLPEAVSDSALASGEAARTLSAGWKLQDVAKVREGGELVSRIDYDPAGWYDATVPGTVLTSLVNDGVYPDPLHPRSSPVQVAETTVPGDAPPGWRGLCNGE